MTDYQISGLVFQAFQLALIWYGIRAMVESGRERARDNDQRHAEAMKALETLIERTAPAASKSEENA